jgi:hypothetical protein
MGEWIHELVPQAQIGGKVAQKFFRRLGDVLAKPPTEIHEFMVGLQRDGHRQLQEFLLDNWATECCLTADGSRGSPKLPPLYTFKDRALIDCLAGLAERCRQLNKPAPRYRAAERMDEASLRRVWSRLGLKRPNSGLWEHIEWERCRGSLELGRRFIIWQNKPQPPS